MGQHLTIHRLLGGGALIAAGVFSAAASPVQAQTAAPAAPPPAPCAGESFRRFDFWVGEWEVRTADGTLAGANRITRRERDCVLFEQWTGAQGSTGMSMNFYRPTDRQWRQVWHSGSGALIDIAGGWDGESMVLTGTIEYVGSGTEQPFRGTWTPLEDGRVRQFFEQSSDGGESWQPWFEGFYTRRGEPMEDAAD